MGAFIGQHGTFARHTPMIVMEPTVGCKGSVTGDEPADRIGANRGADSTGSFRVAGSTRQLAISLRRAGRDFQQRAPDLTPERRAVERNGKRFSGFKNAAREPGGFCVITADIGAGIAGGEICKCLGFANALMLKTRSSRGAFVNEAKRNQSACTHQPGAFTKGRGRAANDKISARTARFCLAGSETFMGDKKIVKAAGTGQTRLEGGVQHAGALAQEISGRTMGEGGLELLRADPGPACKLALEVAGREVHRGRDAGEVRPVAPGVAQMIERASHTLISDSTFIKGGPGYRHGDNVPCATDGFHPFLALITAEPSF